MPTPFVEQRVAIDGKEVPADGKSLGELQLRGPIIAASYYKMPPDPAKFTDDGWFCTGDIASIDEEGYISISDRTKDLIKSGGEWISSVELENALMGHHAVAEAAVIAVPHPKWEERPLAVVVLKPGAVVSREELHKFLQGKFAKWWLPDEYVFADSIPRTSTGKFLKRKLREMYANRIAAETKAAG
jgi:acyl-CoA synthetase (AMP-forming)/AMP-acid ligase II